MSLENCTQFEMSLLLVNTVKSELDKILLKECYHFALCDTSAKVK